MDCVLYGRRYYLRILLGDTQDEETAEKVYGLGKPLAEMQAVFSCIGVCAIGQYLGIYAVPLVAQRPKSSNRERTAKQGYLTISIAEMCAFSVAKPATPGSALFCGLLSRTLRLIYAWGFTYKSAAFVWLKQNRKAEGRFCSLGFWTQGNADVFLLAIRGRIHGTGRHIIRWCLIQAGLSPSCKRLCADRIQLPNCFTDRALPIPRVLSHAANCGEGR